MDIFSIFFKMMVWCMFSLELSHRGDSNDVYPYQYKRENRPNLSQICSYGIFPRDSRTSSKEPW